MLCGRKYKQAGNKNANNVEKQQRIFYNTLYWIAYNEKQLILSWAKHIFRKLRGDTK